MLGEGVGVGEGADTSAGASAEGVTDGSGDATGVGTADAPTDDGEGSADGLGETEGCVGAAALTVGSGAGVASATADGARPSVATQARAVAASGRRLVRRKDTRDSRK